MLPAEWLSLIPQLGIAGPFVAYLIWSQRATNEERRDITDKYLGTLTETIKTHAESTSKLTVALTELTSSIRDEAAQNSAEHTRMLEMMTRLLTGHA